MKKPVDMAELEEICNKHNKIGLIKFLREHFVIDLIEAKQLIDSSFTGAPGYQSCNFHDVQKVVVEMLDETLDQKYATAMVLIKKYWNVFGFKNPAEFGAVVSINFAQLFKDEQK